MRLLAAIPDARLRERAERGDPDARAEMIRRGLAGDPVMEAQRRVQKKRFVTRTFREDWYK